MNGSKLLLDSNILIYLSKSELQLEAFAKPGDSFHISVITLMEVKGFQFASSKEEAFINSLCSHFKTLHIDDKIVEEVIHIRKKHTIKLPDAIILASALVNNCILVTRNNDDFKKFTDTATLLDPFSN
jgi:predicted nucleic acid-binding protein